VVAKDITGSQSAATTHITQATCHPASNVPNGKSYNINLVETQTVTSEDVSSDIAPFFYSITPVLTVFYDGTGSSSASLPEAHLSCLKVVENSNLVQAETSDAVGIFRSMPQTLVASVVVLGMLALT